jgi:hypothetical protein
MDKPLIDPKELVPAALGFAIGLGILTFFIVLGLAIGLTPSLQFGIPHQ